MNSFPVRADELRRIKTLHGLNVVDTPGSEAVTRLIEIARALFKTPIGAATMVDEGKQWFYACAGLDIREAPRNLAFCNYPIDHGSLFEVTDASQDDRFSSHPFVAGPMHLRYYCGAPILVDRMPLGALCLLDVEPRSPASDLNKTILIQLAAAISHEIEVSTQLRRAAAELTDLLSEHVFSAV